jgi:hypothetical protein
MRQQLSRRPAGIAGTTATPTGGIRAAAGSVFDDPAAGRTIDRAYGIDRANGGMAS